MATRIRVREGDSEWTADVTGSSVTLGGSSTTDAVVVRDQADGRWTLSRGAESYDACAASQGDVVWVALEGELFEVHVDKSGSARADARGRDALTSPMPATVVRIAAPPGATVKKGDTLIVLEAMKMELPIRTAHDGVVKAVHCREGELVQPGVVLVEVE
jgi:3-methylcrotonyl-CoA carboxylase alpha subunit